MANWQFHFRNFDPGQENWFGVNHAGCGGMPLHQGRANCWGRPIPTNPQGGDNSVYAPDNYIVDFGAWFNVILEGLKTAVNLAIFIGSGGEDVGALAQGIADAFNVGADVVEAQIAANNMKAEDLQNLLNENLASACKAINMSVEQVKWYASYMGYDSGWGLISGADYQNRIDQDNSTINGGYGWTVLRSPPDDSVNYIANHAFIQNGHLIYMWDRYLLSQWGGNSLLWLPW